MSDDIEARFEELGRAAGLASCGCKISDHGRRIGSWARHNNVLYCYPETGADSITDLSANALDLLMLDHIKNLKRQIFGPQAS